MAKKTADEIVLELLVKVQKKKNEIKAAQVKPVWKTNCSFGTDPDPDSSHGRVNIRTRRDPQELVSFYVFLLQREKYAKQAAEELGFEPNITWLAYPIEDWKADFKSRATELSVESKKKELDALDTRVNKLVSPDQRRAMELEALQQILD